MSDTHIIATASIESPLAPSRHAIQRKTASAPHKVTGKLAIALKHVIETGAELDQAAAHAGLTTRALRLALEKPHVIQWMKAEREVFRALICAQNIHHARQLRNEGRNETARINAIKFIEGIGDDPQAASGTVRSPGFAIVIVNQGAAPQPAPRIIEHVAPVIDRASTVDRE